MIALVDLPSRRIEAWKYSDLARAMDEDVQFVLKRDRTDPVVSATETRGGVIGALAAQAGVVDSLEVGAGAPVFRIDRPVYANFEPRFLEVNIAPGGQLTRVVVQAAMEGGVVLDAAHVRIAAGGVFRQFVLAEGAKLARIETRVEIEGEGAQLTLNGVYMAGAGRHAQPARRNSTGITGRR